MLEDKDLEVKLTKDTSQKITKETKFGTTKGDLMVYEEDNTPRGFDTYPMVTVTAAEDLDKFQFGLIRIAIKKSEFHDEESYLIQVDGLLAIVYNVYSKTLNSLRKATIRQKTVRLYGIVRRIWESFFKN